MAYIRQNPPPEYEPDFWERELNAIEQAFNFPQLKELHTPVIKPRTGMLVLADGTDWNPGSGQGCYIYYGGAWNKLG